MKKAYINPQTIIVLVSTQQIIASTTNPDGFSGTLNETTTTSGSLLSRRNNSEWDDDED